jgi:hypothetical protein
MTMLAEVVDAVIGTGTHRDTHEVEIADAAGKPITTMRIGNDSAGFAQLLAAIAEAVPGQRVAVCIEGSRSYGIGLARALAAAGLLVIECEQPSRRQRRGKGKSDSPSPVLAPCWYASTAAGDPNNHRLQAALTSALRLLPDLLPTLLPKPLASGSEQLVYGVGCLLAKHRRDVRAGVHRDANFRVPEYLHDDPIRNAPWVRSSLAHPCRRSCSRSQSRPARCHSSSRRRFTLLGSTGAPMTPRSIRHSRPVIAGQWCTGSFLGSP